MEQESNQLENILNPSMTYNEALGRASKEKAGKT